MNRNHQARTLWLPGSRFAVRGGLVSVGVMVAGVALVSSTLSYPEATAAPATVSWSGPTAPTAAEVAARTAVGSAKTGYTVMSYNITDASRPPEYAGMAAHPRDFEWSVRGPVIASWISRVSPDLLGLQEASPIRGGTGEQIDLLKRKLTGYAWVYSHRSTALAYRRSAFTKLDSGVIRVSYKGKDGSDYNRYAPWVKLRTRDGRRLLFVNLHAETGTTAAKAAARSAGWHRLVKALAKINPKLRVPLILTGDFNAEARETRPVFRDHLVVLKGAGLVNAAKAAVGMPTRVRGVSSFNGFGARVAGEWRYRAVRRNPSGGSLDYIWTGGRAKATAWQVYLGPRLHWRVVDGRLVPYATFIPSDHWPIVAKVKLTRPSPR